MIKTKELAQQQRETDSNEIPIPYKPITTGVQMPRKILDMGKKEIIAHAKDIYNAMMDGNLDPIETMIEVKKGILFFETLDENVRPVIYGKTIVGRGDILKMHNVEIEPSELGVKWAYPNNPELERLQEDVKVATEALKAHQIILQTITTAAKMVDMETGEEYIAFPGVRTCTNGYKFSVKN
jgi:hypothetical protein